MQYGLNINGRKIEAMPGMTALCPTCGETVIAKCGKVVVWHWAHQARADCDLWFEPETLWHREWKSLFNDVEVTIEKRGQRHRADAVTAYGVVIELQHSAISPEEIQEREKFYGQMVWVFDIQDAYLNDRFLLADQGTHVTFRWKHPRKSLLAAKKSVYLDLDGYWLLELHKLYGGSPCGGGGGIPISRKDFNKKYQGQS